MRTLRSILARFRHLWSGRRSWQEFDEEIEIHVASLAARYRSQGMNSQEAWAAARRQFGNLTALRETRKEMQTFVWLETLGQDFRYGLRVLIRNKGFAAVAVLTLALGIGANTAIFSIVNAAILRPLPYPEPGNLAVLWGNVKRVKVERRGTSYPTYQDWRDQSHSFTAMAAFGDVTFALTGIDTPEQISGEFVAQPYFSLLGVGPQRGRFFTPEEDRVAQRDAVAVLSDGMWKRRFGGDPNMIGRTIQLDRRSYTVIGIAPPGFQGLSDQAEVWVPFVMSGSAADLADRGGVWFRVLARLRPGVTLLQAQTEMDGISKRLAQAYPATNESRSVEVAPLESEIRGNIREPLLVLLGAVAFVLLIASTNVANLLLARSEARQQEVALRTALGASRGRLVRQLLAESTILVALGCAAGLLLARYGIAALIAASPLQLPSFVHPEIDVRVVLFTMAVCSLVSVALGVAPGLAARSGLAESIQQGASRTTGGRRSARYRSVLVVAEISVSLVLLVGAGLMMRSLARLSAIDPGYDPNRVATLRVTLPPGQAPTADDVLHRISGVPSLESAATATDTPLAGSSAVFYTAEGQPPVNAQNRPRAYIHAVSADFFRTLATPLRAGRSFSEEEEKQRGNVAVVTENMVKRFWPGQDPIGKRIKIGGADSARPWLTIVGVAAEMKYRALPQNPTADPDLFLPFNPRARDFAVLVRSPRDPSAVVPTVRAALRQTFPEAIVYAEGTLAEAVGGMMAQPRVTSSLMAIFAALALFLAAIGIYGVMSYTVSRRTREIGLRVALGASRAEVLRLVVGRGMTLVLAGVIVGTAAALALTRTVATLVYGISATDPWSFGAAAALLMAIAMVACLVPASRASRIDPSVALRNE